MKSDITIDKIKANIERDFGGWIGVAILVFATYNNPFLKRLPVPGEEIFPYLFLISTLTLVIHTLLNKYYRAAIIFFITFLSSLILVLNDLGYEAVKPLMRFTLLFYYIGPVIFLPMLFYSLARTYVAVAAAMGLLAINALILILGIANMGA